MSDSPNNAQLRNNLLKLVEALEYSAPKDQLTLGVVSGDLERSMFALAAGRRQASVSS